MSFFQLETKLQSNFEAAFWLLLELFKTLFYWNHYYYLEF